jgi:hypothetical protein
MRSVFIFTRSAGSDEISDFLDAVAFRRGDQWLVDSLDDPFLYIALEDKFEDFEPDDLQSLAAHLGEIPKVFVVVDVSGRIEGYAEVVAFVESFLGRFDGVVQDDHSSRAWTLDQIAEDRLGAHVFFRGGPT